MSSPLMEHILSPASASDILQEHWLGCVFICVFLPGSGCGGEGPPDRTLSVSIGYEDSLQVVQLGLLVGVITDLVDPEAHALHHPCEHARVVVEVGR